mmetsp:Transcript_111285/g.237796  ORF Transcript_111285/g.237796 Transcript_111285/m.237796 type:complete len:95 (-) Transcript_111285:107-391(-)
MTALPEALGVARLSGVEVGDVDALLCVFSEEVFRLRPPSSCDGSTRCGAAAVAEGRSPLRRKRRNERDEKECHGHGRHGQPDFSSNSPAALAAE